MGHTIEDDALTLAAEVRRYQELWRNLRTHVDQYPEHVALKEEVLRLREENARLNELLNAACAAVDAQIQRTVAEALLASGEPKRG